MSTPESPAIAYVNQLQWRPIVAGGLLASAFSAVLIGFASSAGFGLASSAPTWRDASFALWALAGLLLVIVSLLSFGLGGYVAGRFRSRVLVTTVEEMHLWDGMHGLLAWAFAIVLGGIVALGVANAAAPAASPGGGAGPTASVGAENLIAYEIDQLFRTPRRTIDDGLAYRRAEAGRILLTAGSHSGMNGNDYDYLVQVVSAQTGLSLPEADARVSMVVNRTRDSLARARTVAVLGAFMAAASLLLGAAVAWLAAASAGSDRERTVIPRWFATRVRAV